MSNLLFPSSLPGFEIKVVRETDHDVREQFSLSRKRNAYTYETYPITRYKLGVEVLRSDSSLSTRMREAQQLATFLHRHYASLDSFLIVDPFDSSVTDHGFGAGDGTTTAFQLQRTLAGAFTDAYGTWPASTKPRTNLVLQSQAFDDGAWSKSGSGTGLAPVVVPNQSIAPDGTPTADLVYFYRGAGTSGNDFSTLASTAMNLAIPAAYIFSVWLKSGDGNTYTIGVTLAGVPSSICTVTPTWQRFTVTWNPTTTGQTNTARIRANGSEGTSQKSVIACWGAQVEVGTSATQYIPTTSAAVTAGTSYWPSYVDGYEPITDWSGPVALTVEADGLGKRPLSPLSRTNLMLRSQEVDNASWTKSANASVVANSANGPDGTATADTLQESTTTSAEHYAEQAVAIADDRPMACSVYSRSTANRNWIYLSMVLRDNVTVAGAYFDVFNGAIGNVDAGITASIVCGTRPDGNLAGVAWYRCSIVGNVGSGGSNPRMRVEIASANGAISYAGTVGFGVLLWGAQAEQAYASGDYIPTTTATASRTDYTQSSIGALTFAVAPRSAAQLAVTGSFYRRVRFSQRGLSLEQIVQSLWSGKGIELETVKV